MSVVTPQLLRARILKIAHGTVYGSPGPRRSSSVENASGKSSRDEPGRHIAVTVPSTLRLYSCHLLIAVARREATGGLKTLALPLAVARCHQVRLNQPTKPSIAHVSVMSTQRPRRTDGRTDARLLAQWAAAASLGDTYSIVGRRPASPAPTSLRYRGANGREEEKSWG